MHYIFRSVIQFELIFVKGVRLVSRFIFFCMWMSSCSREDQVVEERERLRGYTHVCARARLSVHVRRVCVRVFVCVCIGLYLCVYVCACARVCVCACVWA